MSILEGLKRASKVLVDGDPPTQFAAAGKTIICEHCDNETFFEGTALLNTAGMTFLNLDWANKSAATLMCDNCGKIQWFGIRPERQ